MAFGCTLSFVSLPCYSVLTCLFPSVQVYLCVLLWSHHTFQLSCRYWWFDDSLISIFGIVPSLTIKGQLPNRATIPQILTGKLAIVRFLGMQSPNLACKSLSYSAYSIALFLVVSLSDRKQLFRIQSSVVDVSCIYALRWTKWRSRTFLTFNKCDGQTCSIDIPNVCIIIG